MRAAYFPIMNSRSKDISLSRYRFQPGCKPPIRRGGYLSIFAFRKGFNPIEKVYHIGGVTMRNIITLVLGGGKGTRLYPLTKLRSKPAVPLAGKYRLIDIPISNCLKSGLHRVYVLTQFNSISLNRHINQAYKFDLFGGGIREGPEATP